MLIITVEVDAPEDLAIGAKEAVAMRLEDLGGVCVVNIETREPQQTRLGGWR